jgi:molybdopterin biosynthesis enzyme
MVRANIFIIVPEDCTHLKAGETVHIQPMGTEILQKTEPSY